MDQNKLPPHLRDLTSKALEDLCINCAQCCFGQVQVEKGFNILVPDLACKYLSVDTDGVSKCEVYNERHDIAKEWCRTLDKAIDLGILPKACPYVSDMKGYVGSVEISDSLYAALKPQIKETILSKGQPTWIDDGSWIEFTNKDK